MKENIVSTIKTSAGELQLSEDVLCKHTIFIGSTGSGKPVLTPTKELPSQRLGSFSKWWE